jgi:hypothetical protein
LSDGERRKLLSVEITGVTGQKLKTRKNRRKKEIEKDILVFIV